MAYILNLTKTTLSVGKYAEIKPGKYLQVDKYILESEETAYALRAKWASIHEDVPAEISFGEDGILFETVPSEGSSEYPGEANPVVPAVVEAPVEAPVEEAAPKKSTKKAAAAPTAE